MTTFMILVLVGVALIIVSMVLVRTANVVPETWNRPPADISAPAEGSAARVGADAPVYAASPDRVLRALDEIASKTPRARRIAGTPDGGLMTWEARSRVMGFPDYITAQAVAVDAGTRLDIVSRLRFGRGDMGVNAARMKDWLAQLDARLAQP